MLTWNEKYNLAKKYYQYYKNINVPSDFKTLDGYNYDASGFALGKWIENEYTLYGQIKGISLSLEEKYMISQKYDITSEKIKMLEDIGMKWDRNEERWNINYNLAVKYYKHYGNLNIPFKFRTIDGYNYEESGVRLGAWMQMQRKLYKEKNEKITLDKRKKLEDIGIKSSIKNIELNCSWMDRYNLAKRYYEQYGNLNIPFDFKTNDGFRYNRSGVNLGGWIITQRQAYCNGKLTKKKKRMLDNIGMIWRVYENDWMEKYNLAKKYYEHFKNLNIPENFITKDGYNYDKDGVKLGFWIHRQRFMYNDKNNRRLSDEKINMLNNIGMIWSVHENEWRGKYNLAKKYYEFYGDLNMSCNFITKDGYSYDKDGIKLGSWIVSQRSIYKGQKSVSMTIEKIKLLEDIGMGWFNIDTDNKSQNEKITKQNLRKKQIEILSRFKSLLNQLEEKEYDVFTSSDDVKQIENEFIKCLNRKGKI